MQLPLVRGPFVLVFSTLVCVPATAQSVDFDITESITASLPQATLVELGDLDGDSDLDAVVYSASSGNIVYCENTFDTNGGWGAPVTIDTLAGTTELQLFDGDNDGDLDIGAISPTALKLQYIENTGSLNFAGAVSVVDSDTYVTGGKVAASFAQAELVELGDLDNDGDLDAVGYSASTGNIVYFENTDGAGTWGAATTIFNLPGATALQLFDAEDDGDLEVAAISPTEQKLVFSSNGTVESGALTFSPAIVVVERLAGSDSDYALLDSPRAFVIDDFDNDGVEDDFVVADRYLLLYIEAFGSPVQFGLAGLTNLDVGIASVASGDIDGTGGPDLALSSANYSGGSLLTVMNTGAGAPSWGTAVRVDSGFGTVGRVVVADMDGLNNDDAVVCIPGQNRVGIYPDTGAGALETYPFYGDGRLSCDAGALDVAVVDLDGDSKLDVVIAETGSNTVSYSLNTGTTMSVRVDASTASDSASSVAAGIVDSSGIPAILAGGSTTIEDYRQLLVSPGAFVADDFDNDGVKDDFVIGDRYLLLYIEAFGPPVQFGLAGLTNLDVGIASVASGDIDGTGGPDLALSSANYSGGSLLTVMNTGAGAPSWGTAVRVDSGFGTVGRVVVADMDGLNNDDAVVCIPGQNRVGIYPDTGAGALETYPFYGDGRLSCDAGALDVAVVDLDGDSKLDVVIAETGSNTVSYSLNTGTTMAVRMDASTASDGASSVAAGDTDGDGDADVLAGGTTTVQLYQNEFNLGFSVTCVQPGGAIAASGSDLVASNTLALYLTGAESGQMGYFVNSYLGGNSPGTPINPGGTVSGQVCISGTNVIFGRHTRTGELFTTDGTGAASLTLDLTDLSNPRDGNPWPSAYTTSVLAGETWYWQAWYRVTGGSEFSDAIGVAFR